MAAISNSISLFCFGFAIFSLSTLCFVDAQKGGFSVEFIHRDSPKSPLYNPMETTSDRLSKALRHSYSRVHRFKSTSFATKAEDADIIANSGYYLMKISIGTPAFEIVAVADTGSDLIWTQCKPCSQCNKQTAPLFDPSKSSTYGTISCNTSQCKSLNESSCSNSNSCKYSMKYGDGSFSNGDVATDTLTLPSTSGSTVSFPKTVIGCGYNNNATFDEQTSGIIGLGGGNVSLISQMGDTITGKFSYCLLPLTNVGESSKMNFGSNAIVSGKGVVSTPLFKKDPYTFYFLTLEAISVGSTRVNFPGSAFGTKDGNIVIDSGTTFTLLPEGFYSDLASSVSSQISATRIPGTPLLCYYGTKFSVPDITVHFTNADVKLQTLNSFVLVAEGVSCFSFAPIKDYAIYGNLAQMNFLIGYDTQNQTVSFKSTDCSSSSASAAYTWMINPSSPLILAAQLAACIMMIL